MIRQKRSDRRTDFASFQQKGGWDGTGKLKSERNENNGAAKYNAGNEISNGSPKTYEYKPNYVTD